MNMTDKAIEVLTNLKKRLDNDPEFLAQFMADYDVELTRNENRLICSVVDQNYRQATLADMIGYGINQDYFDQLQLDATNLFYKYHGQGD